MNWSDILPENIAKRQKKHERRVAAIRMRKAGLKPAEIARRLGGLSSSGASALSMEFHRIEFFGIKGYDHDRLRETQPVQHYFADDSDVQRLARLAKNGKPLWKDEKG